MDRTPVKRAAIIALFLLFAKCFVPDVLAAASGDVELGPLTVTPARTSPGQQPAIEIGISQSRGSTVSPLVVNVIAIVTQPDHRVKSWNWNKMTLSRDAAKKVSVPKEYSTSAAGTYRIEFVVYSADMKRRLAGRSQTFEVAAQQEGLKPGPAAAKDKTAATAAGPEPARRSLDLGLYGNTLNPAGGGMVLLWPSKYVGLAGIYSAGKFTSAEGRLIVRTARSSAINYYAGIGYIQVTTDKTVIGVPTRFSDSGMSGVIGVEAALGKKVFLYVEASAASIELDAIVTSGAQTVKATVEYAPVTIGIGLVMTVF